MYCDAWPHSPPTACPAGKRTARLDNSPRTFTLPCSVRVRVRSGVSRVRVSIWVIVGLGLWFGLGESVREGKCPGANVRHSSSLRLLS